jgi:hypothetical protein
MAAGAWATPDDLTGGVLVAHTVDALLYSTDPPAAGWCGAYAPYAINNLDQVDTELLSAVAPGTTWYVLAAWELESKTWCGTEFGIGDYNTACYYFIEWFPCFPVAGLEIPTTNWPGPGEGTAFVTTGTPWSGNWVPVYWFGGYAYDASYGATVMPISVDPPTGFCGFSNCMNPPASFTVAPLQRGGMGINQGGIVPEWPTPPQPWACCIPVEPFCVMALEQECAALGGQWLGEGYRCETNPCPTTAACCIGGICEMLFVENCILLGGTYMPGMTCEPNPCPAVCCYGEPSGHECIITVEAECAAMSGYWHPEWTSCEPNPCEIYTPAENTSWGEIKNMYR